MNEYNWDNVIANPLDEKAKNCIGKRVYFSDFPKSCLHAANCNNRDSSGILMEIIEDNKRPFRIKWDKFYSFGDFACIIPSKDEPNKYIPFSSAKEFIESYFEHRLLCHRALCDRMSTREEEFNLMVYGGIWLKNEDEEYVEVTHISNRGINENTARKVEWKELCDNFKFMDGSPCGKENN